MWTGPFSLPCEEFGSLLFSLLAKPKQKQGSAQSSEVELALAETTEDCCFFVPSLSVSKHAQIIFHMAKFTFISFWTFGSGMALSSFSCLQLTDSPYVHAGWEVTLLGGPHRSKKKKIKLILRFISLKNKVFTIFLQRSSSGCAWKADSRDQQRATSAWQDTALLPWAGGDKALLGAFNASSEPAPRCTEPRVYLFTAVEEMGKRYLDWAQVYSLRRDPWYRLCPFLPFPPISCSISLFSPWFGSLWKHPAKLIQARA